MRERGLFLVASCSFIAGTILGGIGFPPSIAVLMLLSLLPLALYLKVRLPVVIITSALFITGSLYYAIDDYRYLVTERSLENVTQFESIITDTPKHSADTQSVTVKLLNPDLHHARLFLRTELYPELSYGDVLQISGNIKPPPNDSYGDYMAKEHVHGSIFYPSLEVVRNEANPFFKFLFNIRYYIKNTITRLFPEREAAFLAGIMLGDREEFSDDFLNALSVSGTMHLTALSGLHMAIIVLIVLSLFSAVLPGRKPLAFTSTFTLVTLFVAMTGFKVSAIRSSMMAFLAGFAGQTGRVYSPHNALALAALLITISNPKIPVFDVGFQLSFAATISIIYFTPVLKRLTFFTTDGFLHWRDILVITLAAQIGVAPITIMNFQNLSLTALPANIAILVIMPVLMTLGFATIATSAIFPPLAVILSKPTAFLLEYAILIIQTFSTVRIPFNPEIGVTTAILYYVALVWICWRWSPIVRTK